MYEIELNSLKIEGGKKEKKVTKFTQSHLSSSSSSSRAPGSSSSTTSILKESLNIDELAAAVPNPKIDISLSSSSWGGVSSLSARMTE